jgi:hypothetical protein
MSRPPCDPGPRTRRRWLPAYPLLAQSGGANRAVRRPESEMPTSAGEFLICIRVSQERGGAPARVTTA